VNSLDDQPRELSLETPFEAADWGHRHVTVVLVAPCPDLHLMKSSSAKDQKSSRLTTEGWYLMSSSLIHWVLVETPERKEQTTGCSSIRWIRIPQQTNEVVGHLFKHSM